MRSFGIAVLTVLTTSWAAADIITGTGAGATGGHVKVFDGSTGSQTQSFFAYPGFLGGVRVATGDVNNDGRSDIVTGAGPESVGGYVKVFDGVTGNEIRSFFAYPGGFTGGAFVSTGDVNGDNFADIITGADSGGLPHVKVFDGQTRAEVESFFAYGNFTGGVRVASGDINNDGFSDIITGAGPGLAGGHVKVFDGRTGAEIQSFLAYPGAFTGGAYVAGNTPPAVVPEPSSAVLLAAGCLGIVLRCLVRSRNAL